MKKFEYKVIPSTNAAPENPSLYEEEIEKEKEEGWELVEITSSQYPNSKKKKKEVLLVFQREIK